MRQLSGKFNRSPPNVRFRCVLAKLYKVKKRPDQKGGGGEIFGIRKRGERTKPVIVPSSLDKTRGQTLSQFSIYLVNCLAT